MNFPSDLVELLACPGCRAPLHKAGSGLACGGCGRKCPVADGIPQLLPAVLQAGRPTDPSWQAWAGNCHSSGAELALFGGRPVRERMLPYGRHQVDEADIQAIGEVLRGDRLTNGPTVGKFEETFAEGVGARYAVAVSSGTAALHAAADQMLTLPVFPRMTYGDVANVIAAVGKVIEWARR